MSREEIILRASVDHLRDTISSECGSHLCYRDEIAMRRICDEDKHCRCIDIARAIVSQHALVKP